MWRWFTWFSNFTLVLCMIISSLFFVYATKRWSIYSWGFYDEERGFARGKANNNCLEALEALVEHSHRFPVINDDWKLTFNEVQKLLNKTNGQVVGDLMTPAPVVVRETTNIDNAARLLLGDKNYCRLLTSSY